MRFRPALALSVLVLAGCSANGSITAPFIIDARQAVVITSDFATGGVSVIDLDTRQVTPNVATVHSDATLRIHDDLIYVINRFGQDNIQIIDPRKNYATLRQFSTGNGSNPQDIAFATSLKAYVSRYGSADLMVVDPRSGFPLNTISLAAFADGDGLPEMSRMAVVGPYLFVACQRLTNFTASNPSMVVVIDTRTDAIVDTDPVTPGVQAITLVGRNPVTELVVDAGTRSLLVGCVGAYGVMDGGIERIDTSTLQDLGVVISETALGGDIGDIAWNGADHSYAIISDASFNTSVVAWSATTGLALGTVLSPGGFTLTDCALNDRGELYVCDNDFTGPGVSVYRAGVDTLIAAPMATGLPPSQIAFR